MAVRAILDGDGSSSSRVSAICSSRQKLLTTLGAATVLIALMATFIVPDWPHKAKFLTVEERKLLEARLRADTEGVSMNRLDKKAAKRAFSDPKIYLGCVPSPCDKKSHANRAEASLSSLESPPQPTLWSSFCLPSSKSWDGHRSGLRSCQSPSSWLQPSSTCRPLSSLTT